MEIDSGESREAAPEANCFTPFWEMGEGSAGYILWLQRAVGPIRVGRMFIHQDYSVDEP